MIMATCCFRLSNQLIVYGWVRARLMSAAMSMWSNNSKVIGSHRRRSVRRGIGILLHNIRDGTITRLSRCCRKCNQRRIGIDTSARKPGIKRNVTIVSRYWSDTTSAPTQSGSTPCTIKCAERWRYICAALSAGFDSRTLLNLTLAFEKRRSW